MLLSNYCRSLYVQLKFDESVLMGCQFYRVQHRAVNENCSGLDVFIILGELFLFSSWKQTIAFSLVYVLIEKEI